jgi:hypothetical protein
LVDAVGVEDAFVKEQAIGQDQGRASIEGGGSNVVFVGYTGLVAVIQQTIPASTEISYTC